MLVPPDAALRAAARTAPAALRLHGANVGIAGAEAAGQDARLPDAGTERAAARCAIQRVIAARCVDERIGGERHRAFLARHRAVGGPAGVGAPRAREQLAQRGGPAAVKAVARIAIGDTIPGAPVQRRTPVKAVAAVARRRAVDIAM